MHRGFTLIELVIVLVILALMAAAATISVRGATTRARLARAVIVLEQFDLAMRREARWRRQSVAGEINTAEGKLSLKWQGKFFRGEMTQSF